jgi:pimeloyl-ACP methyl ester carboxylesterase
MRLRPVGALRDLSARSSSARLALILAACVLGGAAVPAPPSPAPAASLFIDCRGERSASPTVILESGAFGVSADWDLVLDDLARGGRVCAYDRGGVGASPPRDGGEDVTAIAHELAGMLDAMGETGPVILAGHSNGALYIEAFAAMWPRRVAGLVYVNGVTSDDLDHPELLDNLGQERFLSDLAAEGGQMGLAPVIAQALSDGVGLTGDAARRKADALGSAAKLRVASDEDQAIVPGLATVRGLGGAPASIPMAVIVGTTDPDSDMSKAWRAAETASAGRAKSSWVLDAVGATHTSPLVRDRAYVVAAVDWLRSVCRRAAAKPAG